MTKYPSKPRAKFALFAVGLIAGGTFLTSPPATAAQDDEITVMAPRGIVREKVGRSALGAPIEEISLTRRVSFADLDLHRRADVNELERRVKLTAKAACDQLTRLYPLDQSPSDRDCKADAVKGGMQQVEMLVGSR